MNMRQSDADVYYRRNNEDSIQIVIDIDFHGYRCNDGGSFGFHFVDSRCA